MILTYVGEGGENPMDWFRTVEWRAQFESEAQRLKTAVEAFLSVA